MICHFPIWTSKNWKLFVFDMLVNAFIITPLTIVLWVSTWELLYNIVEVIVTEDYPYPAFWILLGGGSLTVLMVYIIQPALKRCISPETFGPAFLAVLIRAEMYFIFIARMAVWVSLWDILGDTKLSTGLSLIVGLVGLCCLQCLNSAVSMPMNLHLDSQQTPFNQPTRFMIDPHENNGTIKQICFYLIDSIVTALVIEYLIIALWRGAFNIFDFYLLSNNPKVSAWITVTIGYIMLLLLVIFQFPASQISKKLNLSWKQVLWELVYWFYAFVMMVCLWRGFWNVITAYSGLRTVREPYNFVLSFVMHIISLLLSLGLNVFINGRIPFFTAADGSIPDGSGVLVKNYLKTVSNLLTAYISEDGENATLIRNSDENTEPSKTPDVQHTDEPTNQD